MHYLNQAASGLMHEGVVEAISAHLQREQIQGAYPAAQSVAPQLEQLYESLSRLLNCQPHEIALTTGNSHGWCAVVSALTLSLGDRILIAPGEWGGNYAMLRQLVLRTGASIEIIPCTLSGAVDLVALESLMDDRVKLLALTWLPANGSCLYDAEAVGKLCIKYKIPYIIDAAQVVGHLPVDVRALQCDALVAPGRKWLCGPRGTGIIYLKESLIKRLDPIFLDHYSCPMDRGSPLRRKDARVLEHSENSVALKLGLKAALDVVQEHGWEAHFSDTAKKAKQLRSTLSQVPRLIFQELSSANATYGIVPFTIEGRTTAEVQQFLLQKQIQIAVCTRNFVPIDMQARNLDSVLRASVGWRTQETDLSALGTALTDLVSQ